MLEKKLPSSKEYKKPLFAQPRHNYPSSTSRSKMATNQEQQLNDALEQVFKATEDILAEPDVPASPVYARDVQAVDPMTAAAARDYKVWRYGSNVNARRITLIHVKA